MRNTLEKTLASTTMLFLALLALLTAFLIWDEIE